MVDRGYRVVMPTVVRTPKAKLWFEFWSPLAISTLIFLVAQNWSGLDTPDSEFYASLAIFTEQVTDRAPIDSYYWTRLGMIVPAHASISILGIWEGFAVYKALLIVIFTSSLFSISRRFTGFWRATWLTAAAASSSIVVAYFGNPYVSATVIAGLAGLLALSLRDDTAGAIGSGVALGWLAMTYPTGAMLGTIVWVSLRIYLRSTNAVTWRRTLQPLAITAATLVLTFGIFWLFGRLLFPSLNWWQTFIEASAQDHAVFGSGDWVWLRDISLLVPASTLILTLLNRRKATLQVPADLALIASSSSIAFYLAFAPIFGAQFLEAPLHQVLIWPPTLIAIILVAASRMVDSPPRTSAMILVAIVSAAVVLAAGWFAPGLSFPVGVAISITTTAVVLIAPQRTVVAILTVALFLTGAQLLQNSRPQLGTFMLDPYYWAFTSNPNEQKLRTAVNAQQWLVDNTSPDDRLLLWVDGPWREGDRELYSVAAMQLWGENRLTLEPTLSDDYGLNKVSEIQPTALVLYGKSMDAVWAFWDSIPRQLDPSPPQCYDFTWPTDPTSAFPTSVGHTCIVRLTKG